MEAVVKSLLKRPFFVQEVVANALAVRATNPETRVAIELGGQDAVIFFEKDRTTGKLIASDMRMNGVCAGGTGAFIDQVAELLRIKTEVFESYAARGSKVYEISSLRRFCENRYSTHAQSRCR